MLSEHFQDQYVYIWSPSQSILILYFVLEFRFCIFETQPFFELAVIIVPLKTNT